MRVLWRGVRIFMSVKLVEYLVMRNAVAVLSNNTVRCSFGRTVRLL